MNTLAPAFQAKFIVEESGCWLWTGAINSRGYGCFGVHGVSQLAHRIAYATLVGPIPDGLTIDHLCRVRTCVNPAHMEPVTVRENIARGYEARKPSHCPRGHAYNAENSRVRVRPNGQINRTCRACEAIARRRKRMAVAS